MPFGNGVERESGDDACNREKAASGGTLGGETTGEIGIGKFVKIRFLGRVLINPAHKMEVERRPDVIHQAFKASITFVIPLVKEEKKIVHRP